MLHHLLWTAVWAGDALPAVMGNVWSGEAWGSYPRKVLQGDVSDLSVMHEALMQLPPTSSLPHVASNGQDL